MHLSCCSASSVPVQKIYRARCCNRGFTLVAGPRQVQRPLAGRVCTTRNRSPPRIRPPRIRPPRVLLLVHLLLHVHVVHEHEAPAGMLLLLLLQQQLLLLLLLLEPLLLLLQALLERPLLLPLLLLKALLRLAGSAQEQVVLTTEADCCIALADESHLQWRWESTA
jgi:hypothetical protein